MNVEPVSPLLLPALAIAFVFFLIAGALLVSVVRSGAVQAGRVLSLVVWLVGSVPVILLGYRQYGFASVAPGAIAVALSVVIVYAITRLVAGGRSWPAAALIVSLAALAATLALPFSLLFLLAALGIDGP